MLGRNLLEVKNVAQDAAVHNSPERRNVQGGNIITAVGFLIRVKLTQKQSSQLPKKVASARDMYVQTRTPGNEFSIANWNEMSSEIIFILCALRKIICRVFANIVACKRKR